MSYVVGGITIPDPKRCAKRNPAKVEEFEIDDLPILIVPGLGAEELLVEGTFYGDKSSIETTYILPLEALKGTEVTIAFPGSRYDGDWILADFNYSEEGAKLFRYSIKLLRGSSHVIL